MHINIAESVSKNAVAQSAGTALYAKIHAPLLDGELVTLDFSGISIYSSPFFNNAIGRLFSDISEQVIKDRLKIVNINAAGSDVLRRVIDNAREYYSMSDSDRNARDRIRKEFLDEGNDE